MKSIAKNGKETKKLLKSICSGSWLVEEIEAVMVEGKKALDGCMVEVGRMVVELMMEAQRVQLAGEGYAPNEGGV